ncbi:putative nicotinate-nucleotide adenylyltransferase [Bacteroidia bacterium]|nr:putative nicotinate-nucleotide adenylyltransferase [Bacteroidia bacterium]
MKIGILPGSFNPVHVGHLALANYLAEYEGFDQIWFLISPQNPLKSKTELMDQNFRLKLLKDAVKGYDKFVVSTIEFELPRPSYTINTLQKLRLERPNDQIELIIGSDSWSTFHRWKDYQTILKNFKIRVYPRRGSDKITFRHPNLHIVKGAPKIEISATFIRESISKEKDVRFYMPHGLFDKVVKSGYIPLKGEEEEPEEVKTDSIDMMDLTLPDISLD